jgi:hypothetical protein
MATFLGAINSEKDYNVVFEIKRYGGYLENVYVRANNEKQAIKIGTKEIRRQFPRTHMELREVYEIPDIPKR